MILKSIKRLRYKFSRDHFKVTAEDREALNAVIKYYNENEDMLNESNAAFAKLFMLRFYDLIYLRNKTNQEAMMIIEEDLFRSLDEYYDMFVDNAKWVQFNRLLEEKGILPLFYNRNGDIVIKEAESEKKKEVFSENHKQFTDCLLKDWKFEDFQPWLQRSINYFIKHYGTESRRTEVSKS